MRLFWYDEPDYDKLGRTANRRIIVTEDDILLNYEAWEKGLLKIGKSVSSRALGKLMAIEDFIAIHWAVEVGQNHPITMSSSKLPTLTTRLGRVSHNILEELPVNSPIFCRVSEDIDFDLFVNEDGRAYTRQIGYI